MTDSVTPGYLNDRSAITASGANGSSNYCVFWQGYEQSLIHFNVPTDVYHEISGFYVTNATYAYTSMKDGDFIAKKFGGPTGTDPDWFKLTIYGYDTDGDLADSFEHYLADFRFANDSLDYIQRDWQWVDLSWSDPFNTIVNVGFSLTSSDTGAFGMNTPAYACIDDFTTRYTLGVNDILTSNVKIYPNPATNVLYVSGEKALSMQIFDASGKLVAAAQDAKKEHQLNTSSFTPGIYFLKLKDGNKTASVRFLKQ